MSGYKVIRSRRRTMSLEIADDLTVVIRAPYGMPDDIIKSFAERHESWIAKHKDIKKERNERYALSREEIDALKQKARTVLDGRVRHYAAVMGVSPSSVRITSAKKRFGSCNAHNGLNFSCFLMLYPEEAVDYVVVHELCHILHHDHSPAFWSAVGRVLPDYREREKLLR